jgi:predicted kinase
MTPVRHINFPNRFVYHRAGLWQSQSLGLLFSLKTDESKIPAYTTTELHFYHLCWNFIYQGKPDIHIIMNKLELTKPTLILLYGFPGAGKTYLARQLCEDIHAAHVQGDRIRFELFEEPRYDDQENQIVEHLMQYMSEEFLATGVSVVLRVSQRRMLRDLARKSKAHPILIWLQIDVESSFLRASKRDRRKTDDRYAYVADTNSFEEQIGRMQNPTTVEDFIVISGKHTYQTQRGAIFKKLYDQGLITTESASSKMVKPELVNLIPNPMAGRVDQTRRNIVIR